MRASELLPQLETPRDPRRVDNARAFFLIVSGLFLKVVIANHLATHIVDDVFAAPDRHSSLEVLVAIYGYAVQIFADFCGYTNIAIGIALLLGFEFPQNFNSPYRPSRCSDFWRRWHMTLSRWLRDYLYIPLGGSRKGRLHDLPQPDDHDAARRPLARGGLDVRHLGRDPRRRALDRAASRPSAARGARRRGTPASGSGGSSLSTSSASRGSSSARTRSPAPDRCSHRLFTAWGRPSPLVTTSVAARDRRRHRRAVRPAGDAGADRARFRRLPAVQAVCLAFCLMVIDTLGPQGVAPFIYFRF